MLPKRTFIAQFLRIPPEIIFCNSINPLMSPKKIYKQMMTSKMFFRILKAEQKVKNERIPFLVSTLETELFKDKSLSLVSFLTVEEFWRFPFKMLRSKILRNTIDCTSFWDLKLPKCMEIWQKVWCKICTACPLHEVHRTQVSEKKRNEVRYKPGSNFFLILIYCGHC